VQLKIILINFNDFLWTIEENREVEVKNKSSGLDEKKEHVD